MQNRVGDLEAISDRRDKQLHKLLRRLDGAMQMLAAVQDMCEQQRKVILAQKVAITELKKECGDPDADGEKDGRNVNFSQHLIGQMNRNDNIVKKQEPTISAPTNSVSCNNDGGLSVAEAEAEVAAKTEQMLALLQQSDKMQRALQQLEAMGPQKNSSLGTSPAGKTIPMTAATRQTSVNHSSEQAPAPTSSTQDAESAEDDSVVLNRLHALEDEKQKYENMLRQSQQEHDDLVKKMNDMRSLMAALGVNDDIGSNSGNDE